MPAIGEAIAALNDPGLEVLVIPLTCSTGFDRLEKLRGTVRSRISAIGLVRVRALPLPLREGLKQGKAAQAPRRRVRVRGGRAVTQQEPDRHARQLCARCRESINLDEVNRARLQAVMNAEPLALIEYWAVDPD